MTWGSTFPIYLHKLAPIQNRAVNLIVRGHFLESTTQFYAKLKILKFFDLIAKLVHDCMNIKVFLFSSPIITQIM